MLQIVLVYMVSVALIELPDIISINSKFKLLLNEILSVIISNNNKIKDKLVKN